MLTQVVGDIFTHQMQRERDRASDSNGAGTSHSSACLITSLSAGGLIQMHRSVSETLALRGNVAGKYGRCASEWCANLTAPTTRLDCSCQEPRAAAVSDSPLSLCHIPMERNSICEIPLCRECCEGRQDVLYRVEAGGYTTAISIWKSMVRNLNHTRLFRDMTN